MIAFALGADQVAKTCASDDSLPTQDFFGLLKMAQARDLEDEAASELNPFEEFLQSKNKNEADEWPAARSLEGTVELEAKPTDVRSQTIYPEPVLSKEQVKSGGFILYIAGKSTRAIWWIITMLNNLLW